MILVFAVDHDEYIKWWSTRAYTVPMPREITDPEDLLGIDIEDVSDVVLLGGYSDNAAWDSDEYRDLMEEGLELGKHWARSVAEDWRRRREAPSMERMVEVRDKLRALSKRLETEPHEYIIGKDGCDLCGLGIVADVHTEAL